MAKLVQLNIKIKQLKKKIEKKKSINIEIRKQNENKNENIPQKEGNNIKINDILEIEKEFNKINNTFQEIENKIMSDYISSSRQLVAIAYKYKNNIKTDGTVNDNFIEFIQNDYKF